MLSFSENQFEQIVKEVNRSELTRIGNVDPLFQSMLDSYVFGCARNTSIVIEKGKPILVHLCLIAG